jgi:hypothetical protein
MTQQEQQLYDGSLIVIAEKWAIPAKKMGDKSIEKTKVLISKRAELKSTIELYNGIEDSAISFKIDVDATLDYLKKRAGIKEEPKTDNQLAEMRAEYLSKFEKEAPKTWGVKKLTEALSE